MRARILPILLAASLWSQATSKAETDCARDPRGPEDEAASLRASGGRASRDGDVLRLAMAAGAIEFHDTDCSEEIESSSACRKYELAADLRERGFYVVSVSYYEGAASTVS